MEMGASPEQAPPGDLLGGSPCSSQLSSSGSSSLFRLPSSDPQNLLLQGRFL